MPSSEGISAEVRQNPNAIGYDGLGYVTADQKTVAIAVAEGQPYVLPTIATVNDGSYPIARDLYMYTRGQPTGGSTCRVTTEKPSERKNSCSADSM